MPDLHAALDGLNLLQRQESEHAQEADDVGVHRLEQELVELQPEYWGSLRIVSQPQRGAWHRRQPPSGTAVMCGWLVGITCVRPS